MEKETENEQGTAKTWYLLQPNQISTAQLVLADAQSCFVSQLLHGADPKLTESKSPFWMKLQVRRRKDKTSVCNSWLLRLTEGGYNPTFLLGLLWLSSLQAIAPRREYKG